jgi:hypothetical protein
VGEFAVADALADALGEIMGAPRLLLLEIADRCGTEFARERYATTVALEAAGGVWREDGRRHTPAAVFFRLAREAMGETAWADLFHPPDKKLKVAAASVALQRVVPLWRSEALARAGAPPKARTRQGRRDAATPRRKLLAEIVIFLEEDPQRVVTVQEIATTLRVPPTEARPVVRLLCKRGQVLRTRGGFRAAERPPLSRGDAVEMLEPEAILGAQTGGGRRRG